MPIDVPTKPGKRRRDPLEPDQHEIPLDLLLGDAAAALELIQLYGLSRACLIANAILTGQPVLGESFVADIVGLIEQAKEHAHHNNEDTRVSLVAAIDAVETWGLEPERRMHNAVREIVASLETIRQISHGYPDGRFVKINGIAQRSLGVLGFGPYEPDVNDDEVLGIEEEDSDA